MLRETPVRFVVGSRQLLAVPRRLMVVGHRLDRLVAGEAAPLPPLADDADGYRVLSAPAATVAGTIAAHRDMIPGGVQHYRRHYIAMEGGFERYMAGFSGKTRSTLRRKLRKFAADDGGTLDLREYRGADGFDRFIAAALPLSRKTYQGRHLDAGLPEDADRLAALRAAAGEDRLRCFLLHRAGRPSSYLCLPVEGRTLVYAWLGYDPADAPLSPGTVLQLAALERLFAEERFAYFDFTEGEGAHKALFGTASVEAASFLLLRRQASNRLLLGALEAFDRSVARARALARRSGALSGARRLLKR
ncbi:GNAT family N-acetyltransferase [Pelagerythrobacter marinus]|uniref:GNAT family N-acetyltransferase n=1 Tax=Pelagerythrobacter marinus TaxID=538382 RepID=UPI0020376521|nr:GNAT family N-acetyltransferase [Pelagerythrobacter marinus]USA38718.1 GNAT family N-acetyltransferase [Pelagerythrobacter marinus]WPZ07254.1 GNAT family N-acetyltransferase [Pelagerythrobacter marinus]